jgi:hypothetical protein
MKVYLAQKYWDDGYSGGQPDIIGIFDNETKANIIIKEEIKLFLKDKKCELQLLLPECEENEILYQAGEYYWSIKEFKLQ